MYNKLMKFTDVNLRKVVFLMIKEFKVEGLKCSGCVKAVENAVSAVEGVEKTSVDFEAKKLTVEFQQDKVEEQKIIKAVSKAGYQAELA